MAQFPVTDQQSIIDGLNYVMSGPGGLGQGFAGYNAWYSGYLTGNFRTPFSQNIYVRTASGVNGQFTITVSTTADNLTAGLTVIGTGIGAGAVITSINGNVLTVSVANTATFDQEEITFAPSSIPQLYVAPIALNNAQQLDSRTIKYTFTAAQPTPPFALGNGLTVTGINPTAYNSSDLSSAGTSINPIGVVECTTTYVIVRTVAPISGSLGTYVSGGSIEYSSMDILNSTDCDVRIAVASDLDSVFISAQLDQIINYTVSAGTPDMTVYVDITRYTAYTNNDATNPDYIFEDPYTIVSKAYDFTALTTGALPLIETVYTAISDQPGIGLFRYIVEVYFSGSTSAIQVNTDELRVRSISAQIIKP